MNEIAPDNPGDGGAGTTMVGSDASASDDVSPTVRDANAVDGRAVVDADGGSSTGSMRPDATNAMPGSDGGGGDGGACTDPNYPVSCPARGSLADGGVPADCWTAGTDCSSVKNCSGMLHGCSARYVFDCAANMCLLSCNPTCACTDPMYPVLCQGVGSIADGGIPTDCWTSGTDCSTVKNCGGEFHACRSGFRFDCQAASCVPLAEGGVRDGGNDAPVDAPRVTCDGGLTPCGGRCVNLQTDVANCGSCSNACPVAANACLAGQCCAPPQAGGVCNVPACGCATGSVCYPDTPQTGLQCYVSGGLADGTDCRGTAPGACASGFGCFGGICAKYCNSVNDCPLVDNAGSCVGTVFAGGATIPGVSVCTRTCDPVSPRLPRSPLLTCPVGFGCVPDIVSPGASDCVPQPGIGVTGSTCAADADCTPGYFCHPTILTCFKWCSSNTDCATGSTCALGSVQGTDPLFAGLKEIGICVPP